MLLRPVEYATSDIAVHPPRILPVIGFNVHIMQQFSRLFDAKPLPNHKFHKREKP